MPTGQHSFVEWLVRQSPSFIGEMLRRRADLAVPRPRDLTGLAARASTRTSVARAIDNLDMPHLQVLTAAVVLAGPPFDAATVSAASVRDRFGSGHGTAPTIKEITALLRDLNAAGLLWGPSGDLRIIGPAADVLGPHPAGLGPSFTAALSGADLEKVCNALGADDAPSAARALSDPDVLTEILAGLPGTAGEVIGKLDDGNPTGTHEQDLRVVPAGKARGVLEQLVARGILIATPPQRLTLSREAGIAYRGGAVFRRLDSSPPRPGDPEDGARPLDQSLVDSLAAGAAHDVLRLVDEMLAEFEAREFSRLRAGGLGVRDQRKLAHAVDLSMSDAARLLELAYAAGLLGTTDEERPVWLPTPAADDWRAAEPGVQWQRLATAWFAASRAALFIGRRDASGSTPVALGPGLDRTALQMAKREVFGLLARSSGIDSAGVRSLLEWRLPRAGAEFAELAASVMSDALWLGLLGSVRPGSGVAALCTAGRAIVTGHDDTAAEQMSRALPARLDHVILQADLTAVAPGPLAPDLADTLAKLATVEGRGQGTVYRFSDESVKSAMRRGWDAGRILSFLDEHSEGRLPQPLEYLVHDVARRFGRLRLGAARSYVRSESAHLLDELMAAAEHPSAPAVLDGLRRIADTVVVSPSDPTMLADALAQAGVAVVAEAADGQVLVQSIAHPRAEQAPPRPVRAPTMEMPAGDASELAAELHEAEKSRSSTSSASTAEEPAVSFALLREAINDKRRVWLGVSDQSGHIRHILAQPLTLVGGRLHVHDVAQGNDLTIVAHRLTGVSPVTPSTDEGE
ncbi:helicase-associated domain-containing protein [Spelaeicoccus albus]|uniref:Helicase XPB/Ssl2 N-terminal domain-containing protein n=1 Tax=Spelaeicoccus albus TaxID=1280376 RepID=A0A7Z0AB39_9MICO|nr:helicase-associated domain-containing protein [Spelaeicoccus albus]NYI65916.1 hypothetical protein [Spelaeicoccus albus]